ncbi:MAG TPA: hypothetical protein VKR58_10090 [Aquella sp.]|nr:hypothetical protein [Aquella sp.]
MALQTILNVPPLDPNLKTGPTRIMSGVVRTLAPTVNVPYGEFMTWIYLGTAGDLSYVKWDGTTETLLGLAAGVFHPIYSVMINSSGTTASNIRVGS